MQHFLITKHSSAVQAITSTWPPQPTPFGSSLSLKELQSQKDAWSFKQETYLIQVEEKCSYLDLLYEVTFFWNIFFYDLKEIHEQMKGKNFDKMEGGKGAHDQVTFLSFLLPTLVSTDRS